jgi:hypothetical protein
MMPKIIVQYVGPANRRVEIVVPDAKPVKAEAKKPQAKKKK